MNQLLPRRGSGIVRLEGDLRRGTGRLPWVVSHHAQLHGLRLLPLSVLFASSTVWRAGGAAWLPAWVAQRGRLWFVTGVAIAIAASFVIRRWYWSAYGRPQSRSARGEVGTWTLFAGGLLSTAALPALPLHISPVPVFVASALLYPVVLSNGWRWHYLPIAGGWLLFGAARLLGASVRTRDVLLDLLISVSLLVAGIGDHLLLRRTLASRKDIHATLS